MIRSLALPALMLVFSWVHPAAGQTPSPGKNFPQVRGKSQSVYFYPGRSELRPATKPMVLFACGDGGWRGMSVTMAETMAGWGYDTFGLDTKVYLESFTGKTVLTEAEIAADLRGIAEWARRDGKRPVILVGWSEGAGLALLGVALAQGREWIAGLVAIGLGERSLLAWRWYDAITWVTKKDPDEPMFASGPYMARVSPVPFLMLQSSGDQYTPLNTVKQLFALAGEPKKFVLVEAKNHRFDGNRHTFFSQLRTGLNWIEQNQK
ncbi:MAG: hypothetical protein HY234_13265 [Acidobacteria bacterium]|nr:hypothetical protein [Acidobacteriota bacterium]MBI3664005.1 hypothetical protein [Acidobacteriota bacterium]